MEKLHFKGNSTLWSHIRYPSETYCMFQCWITITEWRSIYDAVSTLNKYTCQQGYIPNFFLMLLVWGFCVHRDERTGSFTGDTKGNYIQIRRGLTLQSDTGTAQERTEEGDGQSEFGFFQSRWAHVIGSTAPIYSLNVSATPQSPSHQNTLLPRASAKCWCQEHWERVGPSSLSSAVFIKVQKHKGLQPYFLI